MKTAPKILKNLTALNVAGDDGESIKFKCCAYGVPQVRFKWYNAKDELLVTTNDEKDDNSENYLNSLPVSLNNFRFNVEQRQIDDVTTESILIIKRIMYSDFGTIFRCYAYNEKGEDSVDIKVRKRSKPDPPHNFKVINTTHNTVYLSWTPGFDGGLKQSFKVRFRKSDTAAFEISHETDESNMEIKGLESATEYSFSVFSRNGLGESDFGSEIQRAFTQSSEIDSSEALIDVFNGGKSIRGKKSSSKMLMIIVIVLGVFLIILNASLVFCYIKWKKKTKTNTANNSDKTVTKKHEAINGEAILMKDLNDAEDIPMTQSMLMQMQINDFETTTTSNHQNCEMVMVTDFQNDSLPNTHVVLMKRENSQELKYKRMGHSETIDCCNVNSFTNVTPDIIKSRTEVS